MGIWGKGESPKPIVVPTGIVKWGDDLRGTWKDLFAADRSRWSGTQEDGGGYLDLDRLEAHALHCVAPIGAKACLIKEGLGFKAGTDFWCSFSYKLQAGAPAGNMPIMDLEASALMGNPGRRIFFKQDEGQPLHLVLEGKHAGDIFRQAKPAEFPRDKWVDLIVRYVLRSDLTGWVSLYQDGTLVCSGHGFLMPNTGPSAVYDRVSFGITKNDSGSAQVAYVGPVRIGQTAGEV